jgi:hypothetical protein
VSERPGLLDLVLAPEVLAGLKELMREVAAEAVRDELARQGERRWILVTEAAKPHYDCTPHALRQRIKRGTVEGRWRGGRLYVRAEPTERGGQSQ